MSDESPQYEAFRAFATAYMDFAVLKATEPLKEEIRSLKTQLETRSSPTIDVDEVERRVVEKVVAKQPVPPTITPPENGKDGRGIAELSIRAGELHARFTDSTEQNLGRVVGKDGDAGKDATGITEVSKRNGEMIVRLSDNTERNLGRIEPRDGADGEDGISTLEDLKAAAQEIFADFQVRTFADIYQGVYEPGKTYSRGLLSTWGGSLWLSKSETHTKPGESPDWQLVVKRGADGKAK